ncbi:MAG: GGDEF domain-containing protein [Betaproteobacteria bacterium]|nr:GGDEF domain-containing protein [Betaproteobacteria bacterium]
MATSVLTPVSLSLALPVAILGVAYALLPVISALPKTLAGLQTYASLIVLAIGAAVSLAFRRGRVLLGVCVLAIVYASYLTLLRDAPASALARAAFIALCVLVPFNLSLLALVRERGTFNIHGLQRFVVVLGQIALVAWFSSQRSLVDLAYKPLVGKGFILQSPIPDLGFAAIATGGIICLGMGWRTRSPVDLGLAGAVAAFTAAAHGVATSHAFAPFIGAAALILTVAVLQDSFRMAFRDGLTGLPSRRALEERLAGLGHAYTIAMVDVDHFKKFNDTYGHDLGDQVLKMVAGRLAQVGGGGTAYRYGGEEFTVLFPSRSLGEALPHLEALRKEIAGYTMALRASDRPAKAKSGRERRGTRRTANTLSVTVSIGIAERSARLLNPGAVIGAADRALYRAKNRGRNRVSR